MERNARRTEEGGSSVTERARDGEKKRKRKTERERREEIKSNYSSSHSRIYPKTERVTYCRKGTHRSYNVKLQLGQSVG